MKTFFPFYLGDTSDGGDSGLASILGDTGILTRGLEVEGELEERAVKGVSCTTPQGTKGLCAYITDSECSDVLEIIQYVGSNIEGFSQILKGSF